MQEREETLLVLFRSLRVSLNQTRERAKAIVSLDLHDYLETEGERALAEAAFDNDVSEAQGALTWRAGVVAHRVGEAMSHYARVRTSLFDPWVDWRKSPADEPAAEFVQSLDDDEFLCARVAYHVHAVLNRTHLSPAVPSDGDLEDIPGQLKAESASTWPQWLEILGEVPEVNYGHLLRLANSAALRDLDEGGHSNQLSEVLRRLCELTDHVESNSALQIPTIDYLERISAGVDAIGARSSFKAEESLQEALGEEVYASLCSEARIAALDAERRYLDLQTVDWNSVVADFAKAFELQLKQCFLRHLAHYLERRGIQSFPDSQLLPSGRMCPLVVKNGRVMDRLTLGVVAIALSRPTPELREFCESHGGDIPAIGRLISAVNRDRTRAAHETGMSHADVSELRRKWLGVVTHDGGIFGALHIRLPGSDSV